LVERRGEGERERELARQRRWRRESHEEEEREVARSLEEEENCLSWRKPSLRRKREKIKMRRMIIIGARNGAGGICLFLTQTSVRGQSEQGKCGVYTAPYCRM
jgi:hypothetical protein